MTTSLRTRSPFMTKASTGGQSLAKTWISTVPNRFISITAAATWLRSIGIVDVKFGENVSVVEPVNLYGCTIGDDSFIGPFVEIQKGATIGKRCRIQSHSFICDLVNIGDDCFISHGAMFINDLFDDGGPAGKPELWRA